MNEDDVTGEHTNKTVLHEYGRKYTVRFNAGVPDYNNLMAREIARLRNALAASEGSDAESIRMYQSARTREDETLAQLKKTVEHYGTEYVIEPEMTLVERASSLIASMAGELATLKAAAKKDGVIPTEAP